MFLSVIEYQIISRVFPFGAIPTSNNRTIDIPSSNNCISAIPTSVRLLLCGLIILTHIRAANLYIWKQTKKLVLAAVGAVVHLW